MKLLIVLQGSQQSSQDYVRQREAIIRRETRNVGCLDCLVVSTLSSARVLPREPEIV